MRFVYKIMSAVLPAIISVTALAQQKQTDTIVSVVPEFYTPTPEKIKDTVVRFECYDKQFKVINPVADFDQVYYFSLLKTYTDSTNSYRDAAGKKQFLPVSKIIKRYDRIGVDKWMNISYPGNKYTELIADKNTIVKTDTVSEQTATHIYRYYKVAPLKR